jgi:probable F420-dependent oxidoreductase
MKLGVVFPQTEIGSEPGAIRQYAQAVEEIGYNHLTAYDHVLGADPSHYPGWSGVYTYKDMFHEPLVLFGYLAAVTQSLELVPNVIILPQRQTALVAKQAAEVDVLSNGRLRLGIGTGWNPVEYQSLGQDFHTRGRRSEEQIALMRALWTQEIVRFEGQWDHVPAAGLNPLPMQRPIPIWLGGRAERVLKRVGFLADGWFPTSRRPHDEARQSIERVWSYAIEAGRDPADIGVESRIDVSTTKPDEWASIVAKWRDFGATHISVNTMGVGYTSIDQHINTIRRFYETAVAAAQ